MPTNRIQLSAEKRERAGKGVARALRREDKIPAVIYGDGKPPVGIALPIKFITLEYRKGHLFTSLTDIDVSGEKHLVLARDVQIHPVNDKIEHVDFLRVTPKTKIAVEVPLEFINQESCKGLKEGGVLNIVRHEVEFFCVATDIPESIEVDLDGYDIGDAIKISAIKLPPGVTPTIDDRDFTLATIAAPRALVEEKPESEAAAATAEGAAAAAPAAGAKAGAAAPKAGAAPAAAAGKAGAAAPAAKPAAKK